MIIGRTQLRFYFTIWEWEYKILELLSIENTSLGAVEVYMGCKAVTLVHFTTSVPKMWYWIICWIYEYLNNWIFLHFHVGSSILLEFLITICKIKLEAQLIHLQMKNWKRRYSDELKGYLVKYWKCNLQINTEAVYWPEFCVG